MRLLLCLLVCLIADTQTAPPGRTRPAVLTRKIDAEYTAAARAAGIAGTVSLYVEVAADGTTRDVQVMQGLGLGLDEKAIQAVKQWEFQPAPATLGNDLQDIRNAEIQFQLPDVPWQVTGETYWIAAADRERVGVVTKPVPTKYLAPDPAACTNADKVVVGLRIDTQGIPRAVHAVRGASGALADAAVKAVEGWEFQPGSKAGAALEAQAEVGFQCRPIGAPDESEAGSTPMYRVGAGVSAPVILAHEEPEYSEEARRAKTQGSTLLAIRILPTGEVGDIHVVKPLGYGLDEKAMEAVKRYRFKPGMKDGKPITVEATVEVSFRLL